ncbi:MAG: hypothetical protein GQ535_17225 [Rhodobacteraceae bacterium]|nr:hypothetical protein [Paracoccaceae bacterium]
MKSGEGYLEDLKAVSRPIHQKRILQKACNALPPGELTQLYLQLPMVGGRELCKSAPYFKYMTAPARQRAAHGPQLSKTVEEDGFSFFETPNVVPEQKTLFVLFGGNGAQFLIPLSAVLYLLPDAPKDVAVVFATQAAKFYLNGLAGMGRNAYEVSRSLQARIEFGNYARVIVMGTSSGGVFAQQVAGFLKADVTLSFAGAYPFDGAYMGEKENRSLAAFDPMCACRPHKGGRIVNVFSANSDYDYECSRKMKAVRPALIEVCLPHHKHHNVLQIMANRGGARLFMNMVFAKNDAVIRLVSGLTIGYGVNVVRRIRQALGFT